MQDKIVRYYMADTFIKNCIYTNQLNEQDAYDLGLIKYSNKLSDFLSQIEYLFLKMDTDFELNIHDYVINLFNYYQDRLIDSSNNYFMMQKFYNEVFAKIDESFINEVNSNFFGYSTVNKLDILKKSKSIDELLQAIQRYICSDEKIFKELPKIASEKLENNEKINLYNNNSDLGKMIFENFPKNFNIGETSILNIDNNHVLIMVRDVGHALTIEIKRDNDKCYVNYFIPKICNYLMINQLPGINLVNQNSPFARGNFTVNTPSILYSLYNLIQNVPTDDDMFKLGGKFYQSTSLSR